MIFPLKGMTKRQWKPCFMKLRLIKSIFLLPVLFLLINCTDKNSIEFHEAIYDGNLKQIEELVKNGTSPDIMSSDGKTPLSLATALGNAKVLELLLKLGASVDGRNRKGTTPLLLATSNGHFEIVKVLVLNGADINQKVGFGITLISIAKTAKHYNIVKFLTK